MTFRAIKNLLFKARRDALLKAAEEQVALLRGYVPIESGDLRSSLRAKPWIFGASIVSGGPDLPYTRRQYFEVHRHGGSRGNYQKTTASTKNKSAPRWFDPILQDKPFQAKIAAKYASEVNAKLR